MRLLVRAGGHVPSQVADGVPQLAVGRQLRRGRHTGVVGDEVAQRSSTHRTFHHVGAAAQVTTNRPTGPCAVPARDVTGP